MKNDFSISGDYSLIKSFLKGDELAFDELYARYKNLVYSYLNRMFVGDKAFADDIFQQSWLRCIEKLHKYSDRGNFSGWLLRLTRNLALDELKKSNKIKYSKRPENDFFEFIDHKTKNPGEIFLHGEIDDIVEQALQTLNADQREVFLLRSEDISFKDIAQIQNCPVNTALARMRYATDKLKKILEEKL